MTDDLHTLGKAMRDAQPILEKIHDTACDPAHYPSLRDEIREWSRDLLTAFDKALAETPAAAPAPAKPPQFPTMLRKMWSGGEVQAWINENWTAPPAPADVAGLVSWCHSAARYFENRPTHGEDAAHWANVANAENARKAAAALTAQAARVAELERVLAPFTKYYDLNDCHERDDDDVLEVPVRDLRAAAALAASETPASGEGLKAALDRLGENCWSLVCKAYPTAGGDDADTGYEVISHHMAAPKERIEGQGSTPIEALANAGLLPAPPKEGV